MVLSPMEPWYVSAITAAIGIASKYVIRLRSRERIQSRGDRARRDVLRVQHRPELVGRASGRHAAAPLVLLFATGVFITDRVNKMPLVLAFLGVYYLLLTITAFAGAPAKVAELYRTPDLHAALFFAFFMLTDPPTSPPKQRDQLVYGAITAVVSYAAFELIGAAYFLLAGLLVANAWEAGRRID